MPAASQSASAPASARTTVEVWRLAWPAIGHMLLLTLVFTVDRLVLGRTDEGALASLQISTVIVWTLTSIFTAFSAGTLAVAGRAFGAGDKTRAAHAVAASLVFAGVLGAAVAVIALAMHAPLLRVAFPHAGAVVLTNVERYLVIALPALPLAFLEATAAASLQSIGDTRTPLVAAAVSNVLNIALSCVLVFGLFGAPMLGVRGAAIGAVGATALQAVALVGALLSKRGPLPLRAVLATPRAIERSVVARLMRISLPAFGDKVAYAGGYLLFVGLIASLGASAMAANQAILSVEAVAFLSAEGFGIAAGALVAQKLGAGEPGKAEHAARVAAAMSVVLLCAFAAVFVAAPKPLLGAFSADGHVSRGAAMSLLMCALAQPFMAYAIVMRMALRGAGATGMVLAVTLGGTFLVRMPIAYLAGVAGGGGLVGVWLGSTLDWVFEALAFGWIFHKGSWKARSDSLASSLAVRA